MSARKKNLREWGLERGSGALGLGGESSAPTLQREQRGIVPSKQMNDLRQAPAFRRLGTIQ
jgi:hypothetical protein